MIVIVRENGVEVGRVGPATDDIRTSNARLLSLLNRFAEEGITYIGTGGTFQPEIRGGVKHDGLVTVNTDDPDYLRQLSEALTRHRFDTEVQR
jgi:hypothetical protein